MTRDDFIQRALLSGRFKPHELAPLVAKAEELSAFDEGELDDETSALVGAAQNLIAVWTALPNTAAFPVDLVLAMGEMSEALDAFESEDKSEDGEPDE